MGFRFRIAPLAAAALALAAPAAFAQSTQHKKCAALDGTDVVVNGSALGPTYNASRDETYFMVVKSDSPCDAIDVVVQGPLDCGADKQVRAEGKLRYNDDKIVAAHLENAKVLCALPSQPAAAAPAPAASPATQGAPAGPVVVGPGGTAQPKAAADTPDFYKVPP